jgi:lipopolysaccharide transport system ATP-binding protein
LTGRENVFLNATILGMRKNEIQRKYDEIVEFAELHDFMDTPVKWYSTGMFARLGFSVAVHTNPDVLLVDEVLSVGDVGFQRQCFDKMRSYKAKGITIVFVSHNLQAVTSLCDRVILLSKGTVNCEGIPEEVVSNYLTQLTTITNKSLENNSIVLTKGGLFDSRGAIKSTFKSGEQAKVSIEVLFKKDCPNFYISAYVRSRSQLMIFSTNSMRLSGSSLSARKGESALFSFDLTVNLAPGVYELGTTVFDRTINKWAFNYTVTSFVVEENPRFDGIAFMNPMLLDLKVQS